MTSLTWGKQYENTVTGKRDTKIYNLLDGIGLTINKIPRKYKKRGTKYTTFNEIETIHYQEVLDSFWFKLMDDEPSAKIINIEKFIDGFIKSMVSYIEDSWDPNKFHIILHSSGIDSRILSSILYKLYKRRGKGGLGSFLFACWGQECKHLDLMMHTAGWSKKDHISLPRYTNEYYEYNLNFKKAYLYLNGASTYPVNDLYWIIDMLKLMNKIPNDMDKIELWGAGYFNEVLKHVLGNKTNGIKRFLDLYYYSVGSSMISALPCIFVPPILNHKTITYLMKSKIAFNKKLRNQILKKINPELFKIGRIGTPRHTKLPEKYSNQTKNNYYASWYGKNIAPNIKEKPIINHNNWWRHWATASLVEHYKTSYGAI